MELYDECYAVGKNISLSNYLSKEEKNEIEIAAT